MEMESSLEPETMEFDGDKVCRICMDTITPDRDQPMQMFNTKFSECLIYCLDNADIANSDDLAYADDFLLVDAVHSITTLSIDEHDAMPKSICCRCMQTLCDAYLLRRTAERSNESLSLRVLCGDSKKAHVEIVAQEYEIVQTDDQNVCDVVIVDRHQQAQPAAEEATASDEQQAIYDVLDEPQVGTGDDALLDEQQPAAKPDAEDDDDDDDAVAFLLANVGDMKDDEDYTPDAGSQASTGAGKRSKRPAKTETTPESKFKHRCNACFKMFMRKSNLVEHLRLHSNVRPFECPVCQQTFVQSGNMKAHMRVHTKERPYRCEICDKTYNQSGALNVHMRTHTNERKHQCTVCEKRFTNSSDLSKHTRVHDPSQQITCEICGRKFAQRVNYRLHMAKHDRDRSLKEGEVSSKADKRTRVQNAVK